MMQSLLRSIAITCCALLVTSGCGYKVARTGRDSGAQSKKDAGSRADRLPDGVVGKACVRDAQCANGVCAKTLSATLESDAPAAPDGYCTSDCVVDVDCGGGGKCAVPAASNSGQCLASCKDQSACREGYSCVGAATVRGISLLGTCLPAPKTDLLGAGIAGAACTRDSDCKGGRCAAMSAFGTPFPGNSCTGDCASDTDCGQGGACLLLAGSASAGQCFAACVSDTECRQDYRCRELNDGFTACYPALLPLPDGAAGKACKSDTECGSAGTCATALPFGDFGAYPNTPAPNGYCTEACSLHSDCGAGGLCISHGMKGGTCLSSCTSTSDCRTGYWCAALTFRTDMLQVCVPTVSDAGL